MHEFEIMLGLVVLVTILVMVARQIRIPYPIVLVVGGLLLGFVPGLPHIELDPGLVFLIFLPPLIQSAAFFSSIRDLKANLRPIGLLAIALPLFTTIVVGLVAASLIPGLPLAAAFALGAIVSPPDAVAVTAVASRLRIPRRIITILEGESLVNDATALVAYRVAVAAVVTGTFSVVDAGVSFFITGVGGVIVGLIVGWLSVQLLKRIDDPPIEILITILLAFSTYLLAEELHVSGVLAVVAVGLYLGRNSSAIMSANSRMMGFSVWEMMVFLLNGLVFLLIGLQLNEIMNGLREMNYDMMELLWYALVISLTVMISRIVWVFPATYLPRFLSRRVRSNDPYPSWQSVTIVAWSGMRGMVSLAAALAIPFETAAGDPFPERILLIFLTFCVIFATLVLQGLSLPPLIRALGLQDDGTAEHEENKARLHAIKAGVARLDELAGESWATDDMVADLRSHYNVKATHYRARYDGVEDGDSNAAMTAHQRLRLEMLVAERNAILELRDRNVINDEVLRRVEHDLDLEQQRLTT